MYRAEVKDERTGECPYFVYIHSENQGPVYACRFQWKGHANSVAIKMNAAWSEEGKLLKR